MLDSLRLVKWSKRTLCLMEDDMFKLVLVVLQEIVPHPAANIPHAVLYLPLHFIPIGI